MNTITHRISEKIIELKYNVNITKQPKHINKSIHKKDSILISNKRDIKNLKEKIRLKKYLISDVVIDKLAESIAKLFIHTY